MSLEDSDIKQLAHLARLELADDEMAVIKQQLNDFFVFVEQMQTIDTSAIEPLAHPTSYVQQTPLRLREDAVTETNQRDAYQECAPAVADGLYLVPRVLE